VKALHKYAFANLTGKTVLHTPVGYLRYGGFMTSLTTRVSAVVAALAAAVVLSSCSSQKSADHTEHAGSPTTSATDQPAGHNADDVAFAQGMIPHHQQAIDMATMVTGRSTNPQVIQLANKIKAAQEPEIRTLDVFLVQWKENPDTDTGHGGHGGMAMTGMVDQPTMDKLASLKGAEFDTLWLQSMIAHHQGAIEMAKAEIANGDSVDAKGLAQNIVTTQQAEIVQIKQMLGG
jgi:uncharacterized protein (DUF305 family)